MIRKIGLTIILMTVTDAFLQGMLGAFCVGLVMVINYSQKPYIVRIPQPKLSMHARSMRCVVCNA